MKAKNQNINPTDEVHLTHCLELAQEALDTGDEPFGSILVDAANQVIATARNRVNERNTLAHPELELAHWALENLSETQRKTTTMFTSGEHCTMCAGAHGWAGIGKLVYLSSGKQLQSWLKEFGAGPAPIVFIPVEAVLKNVEISHLYTQEILKKIKEMHKIYHQK